MLKRRWLRKGIALVCHARTFIAGWWQEKQWTLLLILKGCVVKKESNVS
jgi:hypothetical protein